MCLIDRVDWQVTNNIILDDNVYQLQGARECIIKSSYDLIYKLQIYTAYVQLP